MAEHSDTERVIGRLEGVCQSLQTTIERMQNALGEHRDRITQIERIADTVESHGDAILSMEHRLDEAEAKARAAAAVRANNLRWIGAAATAGSVAGAGVHGAWPKIWAGFIGIFK